MICRDCVRMWKLVHYEFRDRQGLGSSLWTTDSCSALVQPSLYRNLHGTKFTKGACRVSRYSVYHAEIMYAICCRFSIDLDLDAPKIAIPAKSSKSEEDDTMLLLDLGHFTLHTATVSLFSSEVCCLFCFDCR